MANILIVDDERPICQQVKIFLSEFGHTSGYILTPEILFSRLEEGAFDLILMDIHMPETNGVTLLQQLKGHADYSEIPVIMLTGEENDQTLATCFEEGASDFINKPIRKLVLQARINSALTIRKHKKQLHDAFLREKELNQFKSRFLAMASHELRKPLTLILGNCELIETYEPQMPIEEKREHFQNIQASVRQMNDLLEEVLTLGKGETGKLAFHPETLDLTFVCQEIVEEMQIMTGHSHTLTFSQRGEKPKTVLDKKLVQHILSNLLSNAVKYSPQGSTVDLKLLYETGEVVFQIRDEGIGISEEDQTHLFDPFHRGTNIGTVSGSGLGLSIVKQSVELHGGAITVASELGKGTTCTVVLPLQGGR